jgi:hypothetical protein
MRACPLGWASLACRTVQGLGDAACLLSMLANKGKDKLQPIGSVSFHMSAGKLMSVQPALD